jgi:hypothetical protein
MIHQPEKTRSSRGKRMSRERPATRNQKSTNESQPMGPS